MGKEESVLKKIPPYILWTLIILVYAIDATLLTKFSDIRIFTGDIDSARYLLSALSQSMAAIFALFFSITLITLQTFGSRYTTRVYNLFFDRWFLYFIIFFIFDIIWIFITLGGINTELTPRNENAIDSSLIMSTTLLLILIPFTYRTKEILKPETIIKTIKDEVSELITEGIKENNSATRKEHFDKAIDKIEILRDISLKAALNREISVFRFAIRKWHELFEISEKTYVYNYLGNTFPHTFSIVATVDEIMVTQGLDELGNIVREECESNNGEIARKAVEKISDITNSLTKYSGVVIHVMADLRSTAQIYAQEVPSISIEANKLFAHIGENSEDFQVQQEAAQEILNIFAQVSGAEFRDEGIKVDIIKSSIKAFNGIITEDVFRKKPIPPLLEDDINKKLYHILYSLTVPQWSLEKKESQKDVLENLLPILEVKERYHVEYLIRVGATVEDQEIKKKVIELINGFLIRIRQKKDWTDRAFKKAKEDTTYPDAIDEFRKNFQ